MRKPTICICQNKGTDQLRGNHVADQRLCFRYTDSTIPLLKSRISRIACFYDCTARFVLDQVGTQIVDFLMHRLNLFLLKYEFILLLCKHLDINPKMLTFSLLADFHGGNTQHHES